MILIIIKFCELLLRISPRIINSLRSYIKHSKECFLLFPNTSKLVKKKSAAPRFSNLLLGVWKSEETLFLVFDLLHITRAVAPTDSCFGPVRRHQHGLPYSLTFFGDSTRNTFCNTELRINIFVRFNRL